jgi:GDPmannose 4,6-dehydratase
MKTVIVTGAQGQDGSILIEKLASSGLEVIGVGRRRLDDHSLRDRKLMSLGPNFKYQICDLRDSSRVHELIATFRPGVVYNLAAMSSPAESWDNPGGTLQNDTLSVINLLDSIRFNSLGTKLVQACTAAIYQSSDQPISENSPIQMTNPYAAAKHTSLSICQQYRERYGVWVSNAIMFNHESQWRPDTFVTRKISKAVARIKMGQQSKLSLWTLDPVRDWGWASEFMDAFQLFGQLDTPRDLILATGVGASIRSFVEKAFSIVGLDSEEFLETSISPLKSSVDTSIGNPEEARSALGWKATIFWPEIAERMVQYDLQQLP